MRISDWSSDVCSSDLGWFLGDGTGAGKGRQVAGIILDNWLKGRRRAVWVSRSDTLHHDAMRDWEALGRSEEHTSELQSLMRISYAVFCLKKKKQQHTPNTRKNEDKR